MASYLAVPSQVGKDITVQMEWKCVLFLSNSSEIVHCLLCVIKIILTIPIFLLMIFLSQAWDWRRQDVIYDGL
jgi:hypothetical protein